MGRAEDALLRVGGVLDHEDEQRRERQEQPPEAAQDDRGGEILLAQAAQATGHHVLRESAKPGRWKVMEGGDTRRCEEMRGDSGRSHLCRVGEASKAVDAQARCDQRLDGHVAREQLGDSVAQ